MGLRCSVLGHKWGAPRTEREREESGSEVVVTVREVRTCKRCSADEVLGETVEVTAAGESSDDAAEGTVEEPADATDDDVTDDAEIIDDSADGPEIPRAEPDRDPDAAAQEPDDGPATAEATASEPSDADQSDPSPDAADAAGSDDEGPGEWPDAGPSAREDEDATILGGGDADREPGEWPDPQADDADGDADPGAGDGRSAGAETDQPAWPDAGSEEGTTGETTPGRDDATRAGRDVGPAGDSVASSGHDGDPTGSAGSVDPEPADGSAADGDPVDPAEVLSEAASEQGDDLEGSAEPMKDYPLEDVEVFCPDCGFVDESPTPSLRGGDSCPSCRASYLRERER